MSWSIKLFRIKGIDVKVHLTFLLILVWAAYRWGSSTGAGTQGALFGIVVTLLLFAAVTLHELGHSLQAVRYGVRVRDITLLPLGGVAQMDEMPEKPRQEFWIAISGPLVNFGITAILCGIGAVLSAQALVTPSELIQSLGRASWTGLLAYLTMANLFLGLFNLVPAFPMDGGRVLRALLALKLDYAKATSIAVVVGQGFALLLGLWGFATGDFILVFIAIFVWMGAEGEGQQVQVKSVLRDMKVRQAMTREPQTLSVNDSLARAVELTLTTAQTDFLVMDSARLVGLLTEGDLLKGLRAHGETARISQIMRTRFPIAKPDEPLFEAQQRMSKDRVQVMPVVGGENRVVGLLTAADINEAYRLLSISPKLAIVAR